MTMLLAILFTIETVSMTVNADNGELNLGHHYYEGDIRLTPKQKNWLDNSSKGSHPRALTNNEDRLWPGGVLPYVINPSISPTSTSYIEQAVSHWNSRTCLEMVPKTTAHHNYVEFVYEGGCSSNLGMIGGRQTISVGSGPHGVLCQKGNIIHEIAHAIGFFHEHSRPDRDSYIEVKWNKIDPDYHINFQKMPANIINSRGVGYDYGSVTHYGVTFFSKNDVDPTIVTLQTVPNGVSVGQRNGLSPLDIQQANLLYGCSADYAITPAENIASKSHKDENKASPERNSLESKKALKRSKLLDHEDKIADDIQQGKISNEEIYGELNLGHHYFEGDILLTAQQKDILKKTHLKDGLYSRGLTNDMSKLWPNGEVPYVFGLNLSPRTKEAIKSAIGEWNSKTCVQIRPKEPRDFHYIEFAYLGGCSSYIGKVGNRQYLSVGGPRVRCTFGNIVHELGHALGFYHEHSRPDRDEHIDIHWGNIKRGYERNFQKESLATIDSQGVGYDFKSIMHYGDNFFSKKRLRFKTIVTKPPGQSIGQRRGLSDLDIKQANLLYKCNGGRRNVMNAPPDIVIATKKDGNDNREKASMKSNQLKMAVQRFLKKQKGKSSLILKHTEIPNTEQLADPMIDAEDSGAVMDSEQTHGLTSKEKKLLKEITNSRTSDINKVSGEENIGKDYFEGDMMLSNEQKQWFDSVMTGSSSAKKRALIKNPTFLWKLHNIPYVFDESVDRTGIEYTLAAIKHWEHHTCLHFPARKNETDYVVFVFEGGCSSRVGRVGGMQKINIGQVGSYCKEGNIIHEIGHALGFFHEQSRTDRDEYVQVIPKNVIGWYLNNFHKFDASFVDDLGVPYDYNSIMHYGRAFFSRNHFFYPTLVPLFKMIDDKPVSIGQRYGLSDMDILQANLLYHCDGQKRLTEEESHVLYEKTEGVIDIQGDQGPCKDKYDNKSCSKIKSFGYCTRFPLTMRRACGQTCQLCGINAFNRKHRKTNLFTKLKLASNRKTLIEQNDKIRSNYAKDKK